MARIIFQDKEYRVPEGEIEGGELYEELAIPPDHNLVAIRPDGNRFVARHDKLRPADGERFVDAPTFIYG